MSDEAGTAAAMPNGARDKGPGIVNAAGERVHSEPRQQQNQSGQQNENSGRSEYGQQSRFGHANQTDQLAMFVQQQPLTAAMAALVVGYFLGKIT